LAELKETNYQEVSMRNREEFERERERLNASVVQEAYPPINHFFALDS